MTAQLSGAARSQINIELSKSFHPLGKTCDQIANIRQVFLVMLWMNVPSTLM